MAECLQCLPKTVVFLIQNKKLKTKEATLSPLPLPFSLVVLSLWPLMFLSLYFCPWDLPSTPPPSLLSLLLSLPLPFSSLLCKSKFLNCTTHGPKRAQWNSILKTYFIAVSLIYSAVLVSRVQQSDSVIHVYNSLRLLLPNPNPPPTLLLGNHLLSVSLFLFCK